eukprot:6208278-Pleurochrysis_carterae.AAC.2
MLTEICQHDAHPPSPQARTSRAHAAGAVELPRVLSPIPVPVSNRLLCSTSARLFRLLFDFSLWRATPDSVQGRRPC